MPSYPIAKIPTDIQSAISALPVIPQAPKEPVVPALNTTSKPESASFLTLLFGLGICLLSSKLFEMKSGGGLGIMLVIAGGGMIFYYFSSVTSHSDKILEHAVTQRKNEEDYKLRKHNYTNNLLPAYNQEREAYSIELAASKRPDVIAAFRIRKLAEMYKKSSWIVKHSNPGKYKSGVTESSFLSTLVTRFPGKIYTGVTVQINKEPSLYLPDFVFFDKDTHIHVDIEIDEPYIGATGQPIHYIGADENRDSTFTKNNWIVIRFAESQIVAQPDECCDFIAETINKFATGILSLHTLSDRAVLPVNQWSKDDAHKMAFVKLRNSYLGTKLRETLTLETLEKDLESTSLRTSYIYAQDDDNDLPF